MLQQLASPSRPGHRYFAGAPLLIAHRGGALLAPENTLLAFRRALEWWNADILEVDVQPSRDGEAMVIHDATVDRTTDEQGRVDQRTAAEIRALDAGFRFSPDGGRSFPFRGQGVRVPTLAEMLEALPTARVNVEIKDVRVQERVWQTVESAHAEHRVLIAADRRANRSRFRAYPGPTSAPLEEVRRFYFLHRLGAAAVCRLSSDAFQIPERFGGRRIVTPRFVADAHARNVPVHVWTVNRPDDMQRLLDWGVDGLVSDRPDLLADLLHREWGRPRCPGPPAGGAEAFLSTLLARRPGVRPAPLNTDVGSEPQSTLTQAISV